MKTNDLQQVYNRYDKQAVRQTDRNTRNHLKHDPHAAGDDVDSNDDDHFNFFVEIEVRRRSDLNKDANQFKNDK